ncbi:SpoIIE family protein phosphatase [Streptomyces sp. NPDC050504]|uniref:SpoIIE family protein phosphatase n=1 Tax=Streptomyces sp. NPDC050504 TaxID=3365618 RepID=UPI0037A670A6
MGSVPPQRETAQRALPFPASRGARRSVARTSLPGNCLAPGAGRRFVRAALAEWTGLGLPAAAGFTDRHADDAVIIVNELVTNAVVHAGTTVELVFRLEDAVDPEPAALVLEVSDHHPARTVSGEPHSGDAACPAPHEFGRGLQLVASLSECWGITYRTGLKTVWARLPLDSWDPRPTPGLRPALQRGLRAAEILSPAPLRAVREDRDGRGDRDWINRGALSFLAEASDLLAGQLDEDMVAALAGQLLVPRLADWCAVWLEGEGGAGATRLARVWHADESRIEHLRTLLEKEPPRLPDTLRGGPFPLMWPGAGEPGAGDGTALAYRLTTGGRALGTLLLGRQGMQRIPDEVTALIEDLARRIALAVGAARRYTRQATISRVLQRALLPTQVAEIPGLASALVYEPSGDGVAGGDFYDIFQPGQGDRWCFALGDVQGSGPEAAVVTGLVRPWTRLLARDGHGVGGVLDRLNELLLDDAVQAADRAAALVVAAGAADGGAPAERDDAQPRFLSLLYGEVTPLPDGGVRCTLASAGHPLPLLLRPDGTVVVPVVPQVLLGVVEDVGYGCQTFDLAPGDTLLCVTDGVTERRSAARQGAPLFDDADGLAAVFAQCAGMTAQGTAERIKRAVYEFAVTPPEDDLALLVFQAQ